MLNQGLLMRCVTSFYAYNMFNSYFVPDVIVFNFVKEALDLIKSFTEFTIKNCKVITVLVKMFSRLQMRSMRIKVN